MLTPSWLTVDQVAQIAVVDADTVRGWIANGELRASNVCMTPGGPSRAGRSARLTSTHSLPLEPIAPSRRSPLHHAGDRHGRR